LQPNEVLVQTLATLMSTGTENIVFNRLFDPGTHWDKWVTYPFYPGYAAVGKITALGSSVKNYKPGQRVALRSGHASHHIATDPHVIPSDLDPAQAAWFALAKIAYVGIHAIKIALGENVLIVGAGPIGQMALRWARAAGARSITVVDQFEKRLKIAQEGGATAVLNKDIKNCEPDIRRLNQGELPEVVIDTTGNAEVFAGALNLARKFGRVLLLGDTGRPAQQYLTPAVIMNGLTIVGAHDSHIPDGAVIGTFLDCAASGRFSLEGLNTHRFRPEDCVEAYATVNRSRGETMGLVFDWAE
jgi:2-desacetyl-2-hydroxyethyl bacteriochlorophyllide A dehydrogenase